MSTAVRPWLWRSNLRVVVGLAVLCAVLALVSGFWLLFRLVYVFVLAVPLLWWWTHAMIDGLEVEVIRRAQRVTQGQPVTGRIVLRSTSRLPKIWLEIADPSDLPGHEQRRFATLSARAVEAWTYRTPTTQRGVYRMGPLTVTATDPFGLFSITRTIGERASVLVYPSAPELPSFYVPPANLPGEGRFRRRTQNITPNAAGIRPYASGDSVSRVHWPQTARTGELMVKLFELDPASDLWVVLDLEGAVHHGAGGDGTEETAVMVAASIARTFISANRSVGLALAGPDLRVVEPDRGQHHYTRILEELAMARATGEVGVDRLLLEESRRFGRHTTVVIVTPSTAAAWPLTLISLAGRGVQVAAVLLEADTFGGEPPPDAAGPAAGDAGVLDTYGTLAAGNIFTYTVKHSDELVRALSASGPTGSAAISGARPDSHPDSQPDSRGAVPSTDQPSDQQAGRTR